MDLSVGIFGDSYADGQNVEHSWTRFVLDNFKGYNYAASATSTWWSYEKFLDHRVKHDVIIFCYSNPRRWPVLPDHLLGKHYCVLSAENHPEMQKYVDLYFDVFNVRFFNFLEDSIFRSVNEICKKEGKYLINVQTTSEMISPYEFPNFLGIHHVALNEKVIIDGKVRKLSDVHQELKIPDTRGCHLSKANNKMMYDLMEKTIKEQPKFLNLNIYDQHPWVEFDNTTRIM